MPINSIFHYLKTSNYRKWPALRTQKNNVCLSPLPLPLCSRQVSPGVHLVEAVVVRRRHILLRQPAREGGGGGRRRNSRQNKVSKLAPAEKEKGGG